MFEPAKVTKMVEYRNADTIKACEDLLDMAKRGDITGMCFVINFGNLGQGAGVTGTYWANPKDGYLKVLETLNNLEQENLKKNK